MAPRYLRFARTLVLVSTTLPAPIIAAELLVGGCGDDGQDMGVTGSPGYYGGTSSGPGYGTSSGPAVQPDSGEDGAANANVADAADAGDGGGPSGGIPELPDSWGRYA